LVPLFIWHTQAMQGARVRHHCLGRHHVANLSKQWPPQVRIPNGRPAGRFKLVVRSIQGTKTPAAATDRAVCTSCKRSRRPAHYYHAYLLLY